MRVFLIVILWILPMSFYGQTDTIPVVKVPVEDMDKFDEDYQNRLNAIRSNFGQDDTVYVENDLKVSVASPDRLNVVYRGLANPISISVPNAKLFEATAPGLTKLSEGKYTLNPGSGLESVIIVYIILNDGSKRKEVHKFRILNIPPLELVINDTTRYVPCEKCILGLSKSELRNAVFGYKSNRSFLYDIQFDISSIEFTLPDEKEIRVEGNTIDKRVLSEIDKLKKGDFIKLKPALKTQFDVFVPPVEIVILD